MKKNQTTERISALKKSGLYKQSAYINGKWVNAEKQISVENPATGEPIGSVPALGKPHTTNAIKFAKTAQPLWAALTAKQRSDILRNWFNLIIENADDLEPF